MNPFSLESKSVLVTGASSGIGEAIAVMVSQMGAFTMITARNEERLLATASLCDNGTVILTADLTDESSVDEMVSQLPVLDGLVLCAGMNKKEPVNYLTEDAVDAVLGTNFIANALLVKKLLRAKKIKKESSIVLISSVSVDVPAAGNAIYAASKGALKAYSKVLAIELARKKIRVNTIEPGMVKTSWLEKSVTTAEQFAKDEARYPLGRYGTPEDIANVAVFLLSDASSWMTGSDLRIDGGISLI